MITQNRDFFFTLVMSNIPEHSYTCEESLECGEYNLLLGFILFLSFFFSTVSPHVYL